MEPGQQLFLDACQAANLEEHIGQLLLADFTELFNWLDKQDEPQGIMSLMQGMMIVEGCQRYLAPQPYPSLS